MIPARHPSRLFLGGTMLMGTWTHPEVAALTAALKALPLPLLSQNRHLHNFWRRKEQVDAPPGAPGHSMYEPSTGSIVLFDKGVYHHGEIDQEQLRRSVYHELAHSILRSNDGLLAQWQSQTRGDGFVDEYAKTSPEEDFCDSFSEYFLHRPKMEPIAPLKVKFLTAFLASASAHQEKTAMSFLNGFVDELIKHAGPREILGQLAERASGAVSHIPPAAKALGLAGAAGAGAYAVGKHKGENKGIDEGLQGAETGMQQAYIAGVRRGAQAMLERQQGGGAPPGGK